MFLVAIRIHLIIRRYSPYLFDNRPLSFVYSVDTLPTNPVLRQLFSFLAQSSNKALLKIEREVISPFLLNEDKKWKESDRRPKGQRERLC